jgi:hypothetical protein
MEIENALRVKNDGTRGKPRKATPELELAWISNNVL